MKVFLPPLLKCRSGPVIAGNCRHDCRKGREPVSVLARNLVGKQGMYKLNTVSLVYAICYNVGGR